MAISVAKQYCPDFSSLIDPFRTIQSFDYFGTHTDQMEFTISTNSDEVCIDDMFDMFGVDFSGMANLHAFKTKVN